MINNIKKHCDYVLLLSLNHDGCWHMLYQHNDPKIFNLVSEDMICVCKTLHAQQHGMKPVAAFTDFLQPDLQELKPKYIRHFIGHKDAAEVFEVDLTHIHNHFKAPVTSFLIRRLSPTDGITDSSFILDSQDNFSRPGKIMTK